MDVRFGHAIEWVRREDRYWVITPNSRIMKYYVVKTCLYIRYHAGLLAPLFVLSVFGFVGLMLFFVCNYMSFAGQLAWGLAVTITSGILLGLLLCYADSNEEWFEHTNPPVRRLRNPTINNAFVGLGIPQNLIYLAGSPYSSGVSFQNGSTITTNNTINNVGDPLREEILRHPSDLYFLGNRDSRVVGAWNTDPRNRELLATTQTPSYSSPSDSTDRAFKDLEKALNDWKPPVEEVITKPNITNPLMLMEIDEK